MRDAAQQRDEAIAQRLQLMKAHGALLLHQTELVEDTVEGLREAEGHTSLAMNSTTATQDSLRLSMITTSVASVQGSLVAAAEPPRDRDSKVRCRVRRRGCLEDS